MILLVMLVEWYTIYKLKIFLGMIFFSNYYLFTYFLSFSIEEWEAEDGSI